jgi:hypothetical protein
MIKGAQAKVAGVHPDHSIAEVRPGPTGMRRFPEPPERARTALDPAQRKAVEILEHSLKKSRTEV